MIVLKQKETNIHHVKTLIKIKKIKPFRSWSCGSVCLLISCFAHSRLLQENESLMSVRGVLPGTLWHPLLKQAQIFAANINYYRKIDSNCNSCNKKSLKHAMLTHIKLIQQFNTNWHVWSNLFKLSMQSEFLRKTSIRGR